MKVSEAMHRGANWIAPDALLSDIAERMRKEDVGALPVGENDRLVGMVTDRDIVLRGFDGHSDLLQLTARDVMSEPIDDNHRMVGMLSLGDVAARASTSVLAQTLRAVTAHHT